MQQQNPPATVVPLQYASATDAHILRRLYVWLGWYFLVTSAAFLLGSVESIIMSKISPLGQIRLKLGFVVAAAIAIVGSTGMVNRRPWGTYTLMFAHAIRIVYWAVALGSSIPPQGMPGHWYLISHSSLMIVHATAANTTPSPTSHDNHRIRRPNNE